MTDVVTKADWLTAEECLVQAWLSLRATSTALSEAELFRMEQGQQVGGVGNRPALPYNWSFSPPTLAPHDTRYKPAGQGCLASPGNAL